MVEVVVVVVVEDGDEGVDIDGDVEDTDGGEGDVAGGAYTRDNIEGMVGEGKKGS